MNIMEKVGLPERKKNNNKERKKERKKKKKRYSVADLNTNKKVKTEA